MSITVALLTYNRAEDYLVEAVKAIINQTYRDFKIIVFDNHSTDSTYDLIMGLGDNRITYVKQPPGKSPDINFNSAIQMSNTKYVLVTHDDDIMEPNMLERYVHVLKENKKLLCVSSNVSLIDSSSTTIQERLYNFKHDRYFKKGEYIKAFVDEILWLPTPTQMFRREEMLTIMRLASRGKKEKNTTTPSGDILMNCQLNAIGEICILKDPLLRYRQHDMQISRHIHQSQPLIFVIKKLFSEAKRYKVIKKYIPSLHALYLRFSLQNLLFENAGCVGHDRLAAKLSLLQVASRKYHPDGTSAKIAMLPVEVCYALFRLPQFNATYLYEKIVVSESDTPATQGFMRWLRRLSAGQALFSAYEKGSRVAIFGSMLLAYMLVLDAKLCGVEVVCCIDTSDARVGATIFDVPVLSFREVGALHEKIELIVMSNERGNEEAIRKIINSNITNRNTVIKSWKELVS